MEEKKLQKRAIESREKLLDAAWKLFCAKGYFNTNTKEIAKTAGVSVGNFYNYYKDKSDIYYELAARYVDGSAEAISDLGERLLRETDARKVLKDYIVIQMSRAIDTGRFFSDCNVLVQDSEKLQNLFLDDTDKVIHNIELLLEEIPSVVKRASYPVMARLLFTMIDNLSEDLCKVQNADFYEEYQAQMIKVVQDYVFGEEK